MRYVLALAIAAAACNTGTPTGPVERSSNKWPAAPTVTAETGTTASARPSLQLDHVTLLQPDSVLAERLVEIDTLAAATKSVEDAVIAYDASHPNSLPSELDVILVARPSGVRCWLVGAGGDVEVPELEEALRSVPKVKVLRGNVGAVGTFARAGATVSQHAPRIPTTWRTAAGERGADVDHVIDTVWPPP
jgi:hypothetical protein